MTNEQAIAILKDINSRYPCSLESTFEEECEQIALNMAIQALNTQESLEKKIEFLMNGRLGEWIKSGKTTFFCSECGREINTKPFTRPDNFPFCHCGAYMRKGDKT